jgi:hypothetical protein
MYETLGFVSRKWFIELLLLASWGFEGSGKCVGNGLQLRWGEGEERELYVVRARAPTNATEPNAHTHRTCRHLCGFSLYSVCALPTVAVAWFFFSPLFSPLPCCRRLSPLASLVYPAPPTPRVSSCSTFLPRFHLNVPPSFLLSLITLSREDLSPFYCIFFDNFGVSCLIVKT